MKKDEVWWARLKPPAGRRPVVLLSRDEAYPVRTAVTVAPLTTTIRGIAVEVPVGLEEGLPRPGVVNCDSMLTIPKACLESMIAQLSQRKIEEIRKAIRFALDIR
ncbi:MAG: type II toxin-antitoxin system PemK/MazF family toxin [Candidatus Aminicenantales bacterium]